MKFLFKSITIYFKEDKRFDYKNNQKYNKSVNFQLDNISKINYKMLVILSYILSKLMSRKVQLV